MENGKTETQELTTAPQQQPQGTKLPVSLGTRGLQPQTFDELWRMASAMAGSQLVPKAFQQRPNDVFAALEMALELGLPPMQGIQNIAVINGRPSIYGDLGLALVEASGLCVDLTEAFDGSGDNMTAVCSGQRRGRKPQMRTFSVAEAKAAGLWGKEGPWKQYPKRMLQMRARWFLLRDLWPDVLKGVRAAEDEIDITPPESIELLPPRGEDDPVLTQKQTAVREKMSNRKGARQRPVAVVESQPEVLTLTAEESPAAQPAGRDALVQEINLLIDVTSRATKTPGAGVTVIEAALKRELTGLDDLTEDELRHCKAALQQHLSKVEKRNAATA